MKGPSLTGFDRALPANVDAESVILGAILLSPEALFEAAQTLMADDFSLDSHRRIFLRMWELAEKGSAIDIVTLSQELAANKEIELVGGVAYIASLTEGLPRRPVIEDYIKIVRDKALLRRIMAIAKGTVARAADQVDSAVTIIQDLEEQLARVIDEGVESALPIGSLAPEVERQIEAGRAVSSDKLHLEMTWGLEELDRHTHGCFCGEFSVLAAEASGGKSALAAQIALANAREGTPVVIFSLEMEKVDLAKRFYSLMSPVICAKHMRDPRLMTAHTHIPAYRQVSEELSRLPIEIDDTNPMRIDKLKGRIKALHRKWKKRTGKDRMLVIIDYLQLIKGMPRQTSQERTENIVFTLRDLPKSEPNIHILALSQYSKGDNFKRAKQQTRSADSMFWGSVIRHAAQNIFMIRTQDPKDVLPNQLLDAEIVIEKMREGEKGVVRTFFDRQHLKFGQPVPPER